MDLFLPPFQPHKHAYIQAMLPLFQIQSLSTQPEPTALIQRPEAKASPNRPVLLLLCAFLRDFKRIVILQVLEIREPHIAGRTDRDGLPLISLLCQSRSLEV